MAESTRRSLLLATLLLAGGPALADPAPAIPDAPAPGAPFAATSDAPVPAPLTPADRGWVERVQQALASITTLKARFLQIAPDGHTAQGTAWLDRPGRMRFQYDKPSPLLLVGGGGRLVFNDSALKQTTTLPLSRTPLGLLLRPDLKLFGDVTLTAFRHADGQLRLTLVRTATPGEGSLTLVFADQPLALRSWSVVDAQGRETRIDLHDVTLGATLPQSLFDTAIGDEG